MKTNHWKRVCLAVRVGLVLMVLPVAAQAGPISAFGEPYTLPETITLIPAGFGLFGGNYVVTDKGSATVDIQPVVGGAPTVLTDIGIPAPNGSGAGSGPIAGVFLPASYGHLAGDFLAVGFDPSTFVSYAIAVNAAGAQTPLVLNVGNTAFSDVAVAPAGFGSLGGEVLATDQFGAVDVIAPDGSVSLLARVSVASFGLGFAPAGFGSVGGDLLVTDAFSGNIYAVNPAGNVSLFATVPLNSPEQTGLRQVAFAPSGFGPFAGDLFVSVSGSNNGGGIAGSVEVVNGAGAVIATMQQGALGAPLDPRGLTFANQGLLIADADPSIILATPAAFSSVPEPASITLIGIGLAGVARFARRRRKV